MQRAVVLETGDVLMVNSNPPPARRRNLQTDSQFDHFDEEWFSGSSIEPPPQRQARPEGLWGWLQRMFGAS
jgi:hypothetical protein